MTSVSDIQKKYSQKLDFLDLELIISAAIDKPREFVLAHPEKTITKKQETIIKKLLTRRIKREPMAYILGHKEFYGLDFVVNKSTLIPRPETEMLVETVISNQQSAISKIGNLGSTIIDIGTGSGNIIISTAKELEKNTKYEIRNTKYYSIDISKEALKIAKKNAKNHGVDKKIKFIHGNLLEPILKDKKFKIQNSKFIILANLPYLSKEIYASTSCDVKKYEPKSALYSANAGLAHYEKLLKQIGEISKNHKLKTTNCFLEISPEQKTPITKLTKTILPEARLFFEKDLAGKWRICKVEMNQI